MRAVTEASRNRHSRVRPPDPQNWRGLADERKKLRSGHHMNPDTVIRMARIEVQARVHSVMGLRILGATVGAVATGLANAALGRVAQADVTLRGGDPAPDFTLPGSDGHP